ncbi:MAG: class I SAM-dependent methyltransferase [Candidatus Hodarchaeota archaeon]
MPYLEANLFQLFLKEAIPPFSGWDFSYLSQTGRWQSEPLPWSYASTIIPYIRRAKALLDMGTGGGEFLSFLHPFPPHTCATESYPPNIPKARTKLKPLGIDVFAFENDTKLPFHDEEFDLIVNRHESYNVNEVFRLLKPSGFFITQQVGEQNDIKINRLLGTKAKDDITPWNADYAAEELQNAQFAIIKTMEAFPSLRFYDIGAIVYYLKAIPWVVSDFSVEKYHQALFKLHVRIQEEGFIDIREHRFLLVSKKLSNQK